MASESAMKLIAKLNADMHDAVIYSAADVPAKYKVRSDIPAYNYVTTGGTPINCVIEYYGPESSGKTYQAMKRIAEFQRIDWNPPRTQNALQKVLSYKVKKLKYATKKGEEVELVYYTPDKVETLTKNPRWKICVLIDMEGTYDADWGALLGIDNKTLMIARPKTGEQAVNIMDALLRNPDVCLLVFDSIAVAQPSAVIDEEMEKQGYSQHARMWNKAATKIQAALNNNEEDDVTCILINRAYQKVGLFFGEDEVVAGGGGVKFAKSMSLKFRVTGTVKGELDGEKDVILGKNVEITNKKNKTGKPGRKASYFMSLADDPETGLKYGDTDVANDITELGILKNVIMKKGGTHAFGRYSAKSREAWLELLRSNPRAIQLIEDKILSL